MMQEEEIIRLFFREGKAPTDDCARVNDSGLTVTGDTMAEGTHFRREWHPPELLARKLIQSNLSDLAAGGADPAWCLLQLGLPQDLDKAFLSSFARAFRQECEAERCPLIGGDTYLTATFTLSLTMAGQATRPLGRHAQIDDALYLTGDVGLSLAGLQHLRGDRDLSGELRDRALEKHLAPRARSAWARELRNLPQLHGMMDLSDGIIQDAERFARSAGLSFHIDLGRIPVAAGLALTMEASEAATSGEEYELLFAATPGLSFPFPVAEIGRAGRADRESVHFTRNGSPIEMPSPGFRHFR